jgi:hypothetical protein
LLVEIVIPILILIRNLLLSVARHEQGAIIELLRLKVVGHLVGIDGHIKLELLRRESHAFKYYDGRRVYNNRRLPWLTVHLLAIYLRDTHLLNY